MPAEATTSGVLPAVSLDFGTKSKAWDDRELVNAYDAALLEFHIHNPGPGSWLDKATAALAKGQPLPGANAFGTEWYTAAKREADAEASKASSSKSKPKPKSEGQGPSKKKQRTTTYSPSAAVDSPMSPRYEPPSPGAAEEGDDDNMQVEAEEDEADAGAEAEAEAENGEEYDPTPEWDGVVGNHTPYDVYEPQDQGQDSGYIFPPPSGEWQPPMSATRDEAIGYALHAQYWAGYWMGVARGAGRGQPGGGGGKRKAAGGGVTGPAAPGPVGGTSTPAWAGGRKKGINGLKR